MANDAYSAPTAGSVYAGIGPAAPPPSPPLAKGKYRTNQDRLFQAPTQLIQPSTLGGNGWPNKDFWGPNYTYVDIDCGWPWNNPGGDWIDAEGIAQGTVPFASFQANQTTGAEARTYGGIDVTNLVRTAYEMDKPLAIMARRVSGSGTRGMAGLYSPHAKAHIDVTYADGSVAVLVCHLVARSATGTSSTALLWDTDNLQLACFIEFDRARKEVATAYLNDFVITHHGSSPSYEVGFFLIDAPVGTQGLEPGPVATDEAGDFDAGLEDVPGVIYTMLCEDGKTNADYYYPTNVNQYAERLFSPEFQGGAVDLTKVPYILTNRWIGNEDNRANVVPSTHDEDGYEPLAAGIGSVKFVLPDDGPPTGGNIGDSGTTASDFLHYLPPEEMGYCQTIWTREYIRIGTLRPTPEMRREWLKKGEPKWSDLSGKALYAPAHPVNYNSVKHNSASAGGNGGSQFRSSWKLCVEDNGGACDMGIAIGWHLFDFGTRQPEGFRYINDSKSRNVWGQQGGIGAMFYPERWYCIEKMHRLNSVDALHPDQTLYPGKFFSEDGALLTIVDGRVVFRRDGMVFRTLPRYAPAYDGSQMRPMRDLGHVCIWNNLFNGGLTKSSMRIVWFSAAFAYGKRRIGPMKGITL